MTNSPQLLDLNDATIPEAVRVTFGEGRYCHGQYSVHYQVICKARELGDYRKLKDQEWKKQVIEDLYKETDRWCNADKGVCWCQDVKKPYEEKTKDEDGKQKKTPVLNENDEVKWRWCKRAVSDKKAGSLLASGSYRLLEDIGGDKIVAFKMIRYEEEAIGAMPLPNGVMECDDEDLKKLGEI